MLRASSAYPQNHPDDHRGGSQRGFSTHGGLDVPNRNASRMISERIVEHEIKVPKKIYREEVVEKVIVVPEHVVTEHVIEEVQKVREKIIEVAKPIYQERIVEVPEVVYVEKVVEVPEKLFQERIKEVPIVTYKERVVEVPKVLRQEKIVEVPEIEYREVLVEKIVEVPEYREQVVVKEIPVTQYVDKPIAEHVEVCVRRDVVRHIPVPVEARTTFEFTLPQLKAKYNTVDLNLYVPRFVEVPVPAECMDSSSIALAEHYMNQVAHLASQTAASLCDVENLAGTIKNSSIAQLMQDGNYQSALMDAWSKGKINIRPGTASSHHTSLQTPQTKPRGVSGTRHHRKHRK